MQTYTVKRTDIDGVVTIRRGEFECMLDFYNLYVEESVDGEFVALYEGDTLIRASRVA